MKKSLWTLLLLALCAPALASEASSFADANAKYQRSDFKAAEAAEKQLPDLALTTAAVYYNNGNVSFRNGKKGQALVAYERAKKLEPRDRDLRWNLGVLKASLPDRLETISANPFSTALDTAVDFVSA